MSDSLTFRKRTSEDDSFIIHSTLETMKEIYEKDVGGEMTDDMVLEHINASDVVKIVEQGGKPVGYYCYTIYAPGWMYWGSCVLIPGAQGRGVGKRVVQQLMQEAREQGVYVIDGHVQLSNHRARRFWMRQGFHPTGRPLSGSIPIRKLLQAPGMW
jgi:GNAT superfamily N-acetyltransferase